MTTGRLKDALFHACYAVEREPNSWSSQRALGYAAGLSGDVELAIRSARKAVELSGGHAWSIGDLGWTLARAGRVQDAETVLAELLAGHPSNGITSAVAAALGHRDLAFEILEHAFERRDAVLISLREWPLFAPLRDDPRMDDIIRRIGFPSKP